MFYWESGRGENGKPQWAVRDGPWKLIGNPNDTSHVAPLEEGDDLFLVNLNDDIGERTNLRNQHHELVKKLNKLHEDWIQEVTVQERDQDAP